MNNINSDPQANQQLTAQVFRDRANDILSNDGHNRYRSLFLQGHSIQFLEMGPIQDASRIVHAFRAVLEREYGAPIANFAFPSAANVSGNTQYNNTLSAHDIQQVFTNIESIGNHRQSLETTITALHHLATENNFDIVAINLTDDINFLTGQNVRPEQHVNFGDFINLFDRAVGAAQTAAGIAALAPDLAHNALTQEAALSYVTIAEKALEHALLLKQEMTNIYNFIKSHYFESDPGEFFDRKSMQIPTKGSGVQQDENRFYMFGLIEHVQSMIDNVEASIATANENAGSSVSTHPINNDSNTSLNSDSSPNSSLTSSNENSHATIQEQGEGMNPLNSHSNSSLNSNNESNLSSISRQTQDTLNTDDVEVKQTGCCTIS
ncbi:MAG: hypothetical protein ACH346_07950 [Chthoniobacterales bacterium]